MPMLLRLRVIARIAPHSLCRGGPDAPRRSVPDRGLFATAEERDPRRVSRSLSDVSGSVQHPWQTVAKGSGRGADPAHGVGGHNAEPIRADERPSLGAHD